MKNIKLTCWVLIILTFTTIMLTSCALKEKDLVITPVKNYDEYEDRVEIFVNGEDMLEHFVDNEMYHLSNDFNNQIERMIATHFFETKSIVFLTISNGSTDMSVQAIQNIHDDAVEIKFKIKYGICEDIVARFFFFEISKTEKRITYDFK